MYNIRLKFKNIKNTVLFIDMSQCGKNTKTWAEEYMSTSG